MHKDSVFKYLLKTDKEFYMNGQAFLFFRGERKIFYKSDLSMHHHMYYEGRKGLLGFTKNENDHLANYYDYYTLNDYKSDALAWNPERYRWEEVDNDKLFLEYCRSSVQL